MLHLNTQQVSNLNDRQDTSYTLKCIVNVTFQVKPTLFIRHTIRNVRQRALQSIEDKTQSVFRPLIWMRTKSATNKQTKTQQQSFNRKKNGGTSGRAKDGQTCKRSTEKTEITKL